MRVGRFRFIVEKPSTAPRKVGESRFITPVGPKGVNTSSSVPRTKELQNFYRQCMTPDFRTVLTVNRLVQTWGLVHTETAVRRESRGMPDLYTNMVKQD